MKTATVYSFPMRKKEYQWEVSRVARRGLKILGIVFAKTEQEATDRAIQELAITNLYHQRYLVIRRYQ